MPSHARGRLDPRHLEAAAAQRRAVARAMVSPPDPAAVLSDFERAIAGAESLAQLTPARRAVALADALPHLASEPERWVAACQVAGLTPAQAAHVATVRMRGLHPERVLHALTAGIGHSTCGRPSRDRPDVRAYRRSLDRGRVLDLLAYGAQARHIAVVLGVTASMVTYALAVAYGEMGVHHAGAAVAVWRAQCRRTGHHMHAGDLARIRELLPPPPAVTVLDAGERAVLQLAAEGLSRSEIADALGIAVRSVARAVRATGGRSMTEAVRLYLETMDTEDQQQKEAA